MESIYTGKHEICERHWGECNTSRLCIKYYNSLVAK